ncbi:MAG: hypothetical protein JMN27_09620 [gamma proteobacterium endosymbiont of Lamellibrachia anaximandri]|nr:hypothetical protein [gamma proteobacterium endosymbiont of Lamellibrachia anaximandri]MBL3534078.1 hypothetical protein [gamma proteobacterium endosymbiont of Lamellibrachia anaximandri]
MHISVDSFPDCGGVNAADLKRFGTLNSRDYLSVLEEIVRRAKAWEQQKGAKW